MKHPTLYNIIKDDAGELLFQSSPDRYTNTVGWVGYIKLMQGAFRLMEIHHGSCLGEAEMHQIYNFIKNKQSSIDAVRNAAFVTLENGQLKIHIDLITAEKYNYCIKMYFCKGEKIFFVRAKNNNSHLFPKDMELILDHYNNLDKHLGKYEHK
jgi:hypothetical protein